MLRIGSWAVVEGIDPDIVWSGHLECGFPLPWGGNDFFPSSTHIRSDGAALPDSANGFNASMSWGIDRLQKRTSLVIRLPDGDPPSPRRRSENEELASLMSPTLRAAAGGLRSPPSRSVTA